MDSYSAEYTHILAPVGDTAALIYFRLCSFIFWFINLFIPKEVVSSPTDPLILKAATELQGLLKKRQVKSTDIIEAYIKRIEEVNPCINAVTCKNYDEARKLAHVADTKISEMNDEELSQLYENQPLFGLPFTIKDAMPAKGLPCTVGVTARKLKNEPSPRDMLAVLRMKEAGAILLAVTTVPELCLWIECNTVPYGKTRNPYDSRRIVGGSSGGEGALLGSAASLMGLGSDMAGSIRIPSFHNGIFGMMTTPGTITCEGHIPGAPEGTYKYQMGRVGPMTRFAEDLPLILSANKIDQHEKTPLKELRIFFAEGITHNKKIEPQSFATLNSMKKAIRHFEEKYGAAAHCIGLPETDEILNMYGVSIFEEGEQGIAWLIKDINNPQPPPNLYFELGKALFGQSEYSIAALILAIVTWFNGFSKEERTRLERKREHFKKNIMDLLGDDGVLFYPSWPTLPQYHWETVVKQTSLAHTGVVNILALPAVQCPMGLTHGIPNGVQVIANQGSEKILLDVAQEIARAFGGWVPPGEDKIHM